MPNTSSPTKTLLIAEDDQVLVDLYLRMLGHQEGLKILYAMDGQQVIDILGHTQPDLLLLSINMPIKSGLEVLQELQSKQRPYPILMMTNMADDKTREESLRLGVREYLIKKDHTIASFWGILAGYLGYSPIVPWNNDPKKLSGVVRNGTWNGCEIYLWKGDITTLTVDAIVNTTNPELRGGLGVDGAIHTAGGSAILEDCKRIMRKRDLLKVGEAVPTVAGNLRAKHVIHAVGPQYSESEESGPQLLAAAYKNALACARSLGAKSIAFPCISTGFFRYPSELACDIALKAVKKDMEEHGGLESCIFCTFNDEDHKCYVKKSKANIDYLMVTKTLDEVLKFLPDDLDILGKKGNCLEALQKYKEALAVYEKALSQSPTHLPNMYNKVFCLERLKRNEECNEYFNEIIKHYPYEVKAFANKCKILHRLNRSEEALHYGKRALELDPEDWTAQMYGSMEAKKEPSTKKGQKKKLS